MSERSGRPPFLIGERVFWLGSGSGLPKSGYVKWIGRLAEMGPELAVGIELDDPLPYGGIDGTWNKRHLFTCKAKHGLIVPCSNVLSKPKSKAEGASSSRSQNSIPLLSEYKVSNYKQGSRPGPPPRNRNRERKELNISTLPHSSECFSEQQTKIDAFSIRESYLHSLYLNRQHHGFVSRRMIHERNFRTSDDTLNSRITSKRSSGIFSFFKWFKREKQEDFDFDSVSLRGSRFATSLTSIDTIFSTATANSFSFIPPLHYRPFGGAAQPEFCIDVGPETNTYKNRIKQRDRLRELEQNVSLKDKYRLYASETLSRSGDKLNESSNKKKRKAPPPPLTQSDVSLPASLENKQKIFKHRRAVSEPVKYAKACHVKGKRKAPKPPDFSRTLSLTKKRAPPPPISKDEELETISNASTVKADSDIVYTDTLKLEKGILKPNMDRPSCTKFTPTSPVSPRPWYKRTTPHKDGVWRLNEKKKEKRKSDEWMFESGLPRRNVCIDKFNIFTKIEKPEEKRKSQISILTNISELDREAAEIVRKGRIHKDEPEYQSLDKEKPNSAKELISLFNDITNVSKVTVNNSFVVKDGVFTKEEKLEIIEAKPEPEPESDTEPGPEPIIEEPEEEASGPKITRVTIEELDEFDNEKNAKKAESSEASETKPKNLLARLVWVCSRCTLENSRWRITCEACDNWRPMPCDFVEKSKKDKELPVLKIIEPFEEASNVKSEERVAESVNLDAGLKKPLVVDKVLNVEPEVKNVIADAEEVRKARLAFFKRNKLPEFKEETFAKDTQTTPSIDKPTLAQNLEENRQKLREMLKEIKHSLPKKKSDETKDENKSKENGENKEAYLIESTTVVEEIKFKKPSDKISAAAQTSAMVRQISPKIKPPTGKETVVPITVEDYKIKDGVLYTSITKDAKKIGTGTFQLMRPKDFANIEAIKNNQVLPHLYANVNQEQIQQEYEKTSLTNQLVKPQGLACFKAGFAVENGNNMNTLAVNRFLKRLEGAIANGQHELAAALAKELAQLKINCSVTRQKPEVEDALMVDMFVEDQKNHQGPFPIKVTALMTVAELKTLVEREYEIPFNVQRWILGKALANDDSATLESMGVSQKSPIFLYLVAPIKEENIKEKEVQLEPTPGPSHRKDEVELPPIIKTAEGWICPKCTLINNLNRPGCLACGSEKPKEYETNEAEIKEEPLQVVNEDKRWHYEKLIDLEKDDLITCMEAFDCPVCLVRYQPTDGVVLRECLHVFCRACLVQTIEYSDEAEVKCPFRDNIYTCDSTLLEREIKALVTPEKYEGHLAKSIALAETKIGNAFHCKTPDCKGWCIYEDMVNLFKCPVCTHTNCLTCQAIHEGLNCKQFQEQVKNNCDSNLDSKRTKEMLQEMVDRGEAMNCPTCQVVLMKKWGCDWLRCSMCKTEICWITRGPRWGPNGKGDTNGGCKCGINGIKCHPKCTYCH